MRRHVSLLAVGGATLLIALSTTAIDAHKAVTSTYTYNDDIYPILKAKCGRCHIEGGPAPMSLLTYNDDGGAVAWAESIKEMLLSDAMPPYYADPTGPAVKNPHGLTPRELDKILTWAIGGTPHGDLNKTEKPPVMKAGWNYGKPDATFAMAKEFSLGPGEMEKSNDFTIPTGFTEDKWVKAVDLLPGTPSIVRQAMIGIDGGQLLAIWQPGDDAVTPPAGAAFRIPANAKLRVIIRYKKGWQDEQETRTDKSTVGVYFADKAAAPKAISSINIDGPKGEAETAPSFSGTVANAGRLLAIRPSVDQAYRTVEISAVDAAGKRTPLLKLRGMRPEWPRRYWLEKPIDLAAGTKIEVKTTAADPDRGPLGPGVQAPLQVGLDLVS